MISLSVHPSNVQRQARPHASASSTDPNHNDAMLQRGNRTRLCVAIQVHKTLDSPFMMSSEAKTEHSQSSPPTIPHREQKPEKTRVPTPDASTREMHYSGLESDTIISASHRKPPSISVPAQMNHLNLSRRELLLGSSTMIAFSGLSDSPFRNQDMPQLAQLINGKAFHLPSARMDYPISSE